VARRGRDAAPTWSGSRTLTRHRAALAMLQSDWSYVSSQPRFAYLQRALREIDPPGP